MNRKHKKCVRFPACRKCKGFEAYLSRVNAVCPISARENSNSIMPRKNEGLIPFPEEHQIGWIASMPLMKGL